MNAMVQTTQGYVFNFPTAKCHLCPNVHYYHMMFDAVQVAPTGRLCKGCWTAYKNEGRKKNHAMESKKKQKQMELVA